MRRSALSLPLVVLAVHGSAAAATWAPSQAPEILVVASTPIPGAGVDVDKAPGEVEVMTSRSLARDGEPNLLRTLAQEAGAVSLGSASGNPYQPSLSYHGFTASPLQGTPQGLAVYVDGVRFNSAFGDTVNWDMIPSVAIDRLTIEGSNPVFGLNALGGALNVELKTGFTFTGGEADVSGGAFGQAQGDLQWGGRTGDVALYAAAGALRQDGWRDLQSSAVQNLYGDLGWRPKGADLHLSVRLAHSDLNGPGTAPVELLKADRAAQFTAPNAVKNRAAEINLRGAIPLANGVSVQGVAYGATFKQDVLNGNAPNDVPCADGSGLLCAADGYTTTLGARPVPAFLGSSPFAYAQLDTQATTTDSFGGSVQIVDARRLFGLSNHAVLGAGYDGAQTRFDASSEIGGIGATSRAFIGPGVVIDEPGVDQPVSLRVGDAAYGVFASDTLDLTPRLSVSVSGRYNHAQIDLHDRLGTVLSGDHAYSRFNPAVGAAWRARPWLTVYAGYAEASRAPTPAELSCASPADSCSLANFFVGDPNLRQVTARTVESGLRGRLTPFAGAQLTFDVSIYRTDLANDIAFVNAPTLGRAYFANVGATRRQGLDAGARITATGWSGYLSYARAEATFRTRIVEPGGDNPGADANGDLTILPGDHLPGVPASQIKFGLDLQVTRRLSLGAAGVGQSGQYLSGDGANVTPKLPGFFVLNLNAAYQLTPRLQLFARVENAADAAYATYGTFSPTTSVFLANAPNATNPRSYSPAAPLGGYGGVRIRF